MINIGFSPNIFIGVFVALSVLGLYLLRVVKYDLARDVDIFFSTLGIIYSVILVFHGWRLDPILLFSQIIIVITLLAFGWENIRLRGLASRKYK